MEYIIASIAIAAFVAAMLFLASSARHDRDKPNVNPIVPEPMTPSEVIERDIAHQIAASAKPAPKSKK